MTMSTTAPVQRIVTTADGYVSAEGRRPAVHLSASAVDDRPHLYVFGCGDEHAPDTDDVPGPCGIANCHGQTADED